MKLLLACFVSCLAMLGISGCSTVRVPVVVQHPAEIDLSGYRQIALGTFQGDLGSKFYDRIKQGLVDSPSRFQVLDRSGLNQILGELRLSQSDLVDVRYRAKTGRLLGATALITGGMYKTYNESSSSSQRTCKTKERGEYNCRVYERSGVLSTSGSVDVIDLQTGQILKSKALNDTCAVTNSAIDESPAYINVNALAEQCLQNQVNIFMRSVSIWSEVISAAFEEDSDIPEIDRGIAYAKTGDMREAANIFSSAARAAEKSRSVDGEEIAIAYGNAGLAYLYTREYDKAIDSFKRAFSFHQDEKYLQEKRRAEYLKHDRQKLDDQLGRKR